MINLSPNTTQPLPSTTVESSNVGEQTGRSESVGYLSRGQLTPLNENENHLRFHFRQCERHDGHASFPIHFLQPGSAQWRGHVFRITRKRGAKQLLDPHPQCKTVARMPKWAYYGARTGQRQYCALVITTRLIRELQNDLGVGRKVRQLYSMKELIIRKPQSDVRKI